MGMFRANLRWKSAIPNTLRVCLSSPFNRHLKRPRSLLYRHLLLLLESHPFLLTCSQVPRISVLIVRFDRLYRAMPWPLSAGDIQLTVLPARSTLNLSALIVSCLSLNVGSHYMIEKPPLKLATPAASHITVCDITCLAIYIILVKVRLELLCKARCVLKRHPISKIGAFLSSSKTRA